MLLRNADLNSTIIKKKEWLYHKVSIMVTSRGAAGGCDWREKWKGFLGALTVFISWSGYSDICFIIILELYVYFMHSYLCIFLIVKKIKKILYVIYMGWLVQMLMDQVLLL